MIIILCWSSQFMNISHVVFTCSLIAPWLLHSCVYSDQQHLLTSNNPALPCRRCNYSNSIHPQPAQATSKLQRACSPPYILQGSQSTASISCSRHCAVSARQSWHSSSACTAAWKCRSNCSEWRCAPPLWHPHCSTSRPQPT